MPFEASITAAPHTVSEPKKKKKGTPPAGRRTGPARTTSVSRLRRSPQDARSSGSSSARHASSAWRLPAQPQHGSPWSTRPRPARPRRPRRARSGAKRVTPRRPSGPHQDGGCRRGPAGPSGSTGAPPRRIRTGEVGGQPGGAVASSTERPARVSRAGLLLPPGSGTLCHSLRSGHAGTVRPEAGGGVGRLADVDHHGQPSTATQYVPTSRWLCRSPLWPALTATVSPPASRPSPARRAPAPAAAIPRGEPGSPVGLGRMPARVRQPGERPAEPGRPPAGRSARASSRGRGRPRRRAARPTGGARATAARPAGGRGRPPR